MSEEITTILQDLGLSKTESTVYLELINLGASPVTSIAKVCKLHRANVYDALKKLVDRGLASHILRNKTTIYEAAHPKVLLRLIKEKENNVNSILPQLAMRRTFAETKGIAQVYEGVSALLRILYSWLDHNEDILVFGIPKIAPDLIKTKIPHFHTERIARKISMLHIYNYDALDRIHFLNKMPFTQAKYLPAHFDSQVTTNICGDEVVLVFWEKPVTVIKIKNKNVAQSYKNYFNLLYKNAKK